ncbi:hypothetical protein DFJ63DRAFT_287389 [Scheffersomyces coipomensis]|uniref:uncharacterized protein n=1 Tax=Scheffersomyces coipomensis TaxID=1788519 RepID=UPI00315D2982
MNNIRKINEINQRELSQNINYTQSWHYDYRDTNYIYIGNIPIEYMKSIDIIKIFSQYGVPTHIHFFDGKQNEGKQSSFQKDNGFAFVKYENFKSCILAIDNFNGIEVLDGKKLKVDHCYYKLRGGEKESDYLIDYSEIKLMIEESHTNDKKTNVNDDDDELRDPMESFLSKKQETAKDDEIDDELKDPMEQFLKQKEDKSKHHRSHRHSHRHHRSSDRHSRDKESKHRDHSPKRG